jgi:flavodoxin I
MDLTNYKMRLAIIYTSITGNTEAVADELYRLFHTNSVDITMYRVEEFDITNLYQFDAIAIGTYTWGNGEIPMEMQGLYYEFESLCKKDMITAVFGTGDSFYPNYCGAVDRFRDMLYVHTNLAATLKVELSPQNQDVYRFQRFVESMIKCSKILMKDNECKV